MRQVREQRRWTSSHSSVAENGSAMAFSQASPTEPMARGSLKNSVLLYRLGSRRDLAKPCLNPFEMCQASGRCGSP